MAFNKPTVPSVLGTKSDYIPHSQVSKVKHYRNNILIACKDGSLYVTREFTVDANGMRGEFEREPYNNAVIDTGMKYANKQPVKLGDKVSITEYPLKPNECIDPYANTE